MLINDTTLKANADVTIEYDKDKKQWFVSTKGTLNYAGNPLSLKSEPKSIDEITNLPMKTFVKGISSIFEFLHMVTDATANQTGVKCKIGYPSMTVGFTGLERVEKENSSEIGYVCDKVSVGFDPLIDVTIEADILEVILKLIKKMPLVGAAAKALEFLTNAKKDKNVSIMLTAENKIKGKIETQIAKLMKEPDPKLEKELNSSLDFTIEGKAHIEGRVWIIQASAALSLSVTTGIGLTVVAKEDGTMDWGFMFNGLVIYYMADIKVEKNKKKNTDSRDDSVPTNESDDTSLSYHKDNKDEPITLIKKREGNISSDPTASASDTDSLKQPSSFFDFIFEDKLNEINSNIVYADMTGDGKLDKLDMTPQTISTGSSIKLDN